MADGALRAHPIDELFEAVDERVGLPERDQVLAERGTVSREETRRENLRAAWRRRKTKSRKPPLSTAEIVERATARARAKADVRANGSGEQR